MTQPQQITHTKTWWAWLSRWQNKTRNKARTKEKKIGATQLDTPLHTFHCSFANLCPSSQKFPVDPTKQKKPKKNATFSPDIVIFPSNT